MKKYLKAILVISLFVSCTDKVYYSSSWQSKPVTIDGNIPEWSNPLRFYDQETGISYCISNDNYNLYFCCSIGNEFLQTKILRAGIEFRIDTLGKKSFGVAIKYPVGNISETTLEPKSTPQEKSNPNEKLDKSTFQLKLLAEAREIELAGFKPSLGRLISVIPPSNTGIKAAINFDNRGFMNYEAVIPFSTFYKNELTPSDSNRVFNYQIKVNGVNNSNNGGNNSNGTRGGGMRGGGMGGGGGMRGSGMGGGGGMRGGGMGGGGGMRGGNRYGDSGGNGYQRNANMSGTTKTTIKLKLAYK
jgi:hypothetical protein